MSAVDAIDGVRSDPFGRYGRSPYLQETDQSYGGLNPAMATVARMMIAMAVLDMLSQLLTPPQPDEGAGDSPQDGRPGKDAQQCLQGLQKFMDGPEDSSDGDRSEGTDPAGDGGSSDPYGDPSARSKPGSHDKPGPKETSSPDEGRTESTSGTTGTRPSNRIPDAKGTVTVHEPIVVKAGQPFDGGGKLYKAGPELGDGGQSESQKPVFILEPGATLQNVQVQGADGVHAMGDAKLKNVWWRDVGEDAFTLKKPGNVTVEGGGALHASDKVFQINAPGSVSIKDFYAEDFGKLLRQNGGTTFPLTVRLDNVTAKDGKEALVRTDSPSAKIYLDNVDPGNTKWDVLAPPGALVEGAIRPGYKPHTPK